MLVNGLAQWHITSGIIENGQNSQSPMRNSVVTPWDDRIRYRWVSPEHLHQVHFGIGEYQLLLSLVLCLGMFGEEGVAPLRQEKTSSDPPANPPASRQSSTLPSSLLSPYELHPLAQNFHYHVAHSLEIRFHYAGYTLYRVAHAIVINPRPTCIFAVSIPDEAYLCQYRQRSRFASSWLLKRA